jgi:hypothetical protein
MESGLTGEGGAAKPQAKAIRDSQKRPGKESKHQNGTADFVDDPHLPCTCEINQVSLVFERSKRPWN